MPGDLTPEGDGVASHLAPDNVFELLVHVANTTDLEMAITLHVHGQMVTGKLISGATYWEESAAKMRSGGQGSEELVESLASSMELVANEYRRTYADEKVDEDLPMTAFIHLRDARTITPQGPTPEAGAFWRGRLSAVDGFSLGELQPKS